MTDAVSELVRMEDRIKDLESSERQGGGVGLERLDTKSGSASAYDFTDIPDDGRHLEIIASLRSTQSAVRTMLQCQLNADTGSNYNFLNWDVDKIPTFVSVEESESFAVARMDLSYIAGASAQGNMYSPVRIYLPDYLGSHYSRLRMQSGRANSFSFRDSLASHGQGTWKDTAAVTSIKIYPASGSFASGSAASLYMWK
jgi:hypothetical protein